MGLIGNIKESATWLLGIPGEPLMQALRLNVGGLIGSIFRIPHKLIQSGKALFGRSSTQVQRKAQEAFRAQYPNGSPGYW